MAKDVVVFASEATQHIEELMRISATHVSQVLHLKDQVRLAERHIGEIDADTQQYIAGYARLRNLVLSL